MAKMRVPNYAEVGTIEKDENGKPYLLVTLTPLDAGHFCPDWDYDWIRPQDPEYDACTCHGDAVGEALARSQAACPIQDHRIKCDPTWDTPMPADPKPVVSPPVTKPKDPETSALADRYGGEVPT